MMGRGTLSIDVATLRRVLPMRMRSVGFVVDGSRMCDMGVMSVDITVPGHGEYEVRGYIDGMLRRLTLVDGMLSYRLLSEDGLMLIRIEWD